ncbi:MAG: hypothetical protein J6R40_05065 [Clostridia bacterium]|nr:hypothetical protein [Clostridia bacterium]
MTGIILACVAIALACAGVIVYIIERPTGGKANKSIFDVGYNHMADDAPQIPDEEAANEGENEETPAEEAQESDNSDETQA